LQQRCLRIAHLIARNNTALAMPLWLATICMF